MIALTLRQQVRRHCRLHGWPDGAANDAAEIAVEVAESNLPLFGDALREVLAEACRADQWGDA